jgi:hypothetical protein
MPNWIDEAADSHIVWQWIGPALDGPMSKWHFDNSGDYGVIIIDTWKDESKQEVK